MTNPIPENVIYVLKPASHVLVDDITEKVQGAAIVDANNSSSLKAALRWAGPQAVQHCRPNEDIPSLRFIQVEYGRHHTSSWHARIFDRFHVEISDGTLADLIRNGQMEDGKFLGPFRWGTAGSGLKLLRVGSVEWGVVTGKSDRKAMPKIRKSELEIGRIYVHENLTSWVYLGMVDTTSYESQYTTPMTYKLATESGELWVPLRDLPIRGHMGGIRVHNGHRVVEALGMSEHAGSDPIATIRAVAREKALRGIKARDDHNAAQALAPRSGTYNQTYRAHGRPQITQPDSQYFAGESYHLLMRRPGEPMPVVPELAGIESSVVK